MSKIRTASTAALATLALGAGVAATAVAPAEARSVCATRNVQCSMSYARSTVALMPGTAGTKVVALQRALYNVGFSVRITGRYDAQTRAAVKSYQVSRRISPASGILDSRTLNFLRAGAGARHTATSTTTTTTRVSAGVSSTASRAVAFAYSQLGKPYVYGATGPYSYDCSGLVQAAYRAAGKSIPRTSYEQLAAYRRVSTSQLRPGDIVGFYGGGHVAIYIGNGMVIHAPHTGTVVKKAALSTMPVYYAVRPTA